MPSKRLLLLLATVGVASLLIIGLGTYAATGLARFQRIESRRATLVYAAPQELRPGVNVGLAGLAGTLARLGYRETESQPAAPGQFRRDAGSWEIFLVAPSVPGRPTARRIRLEVEGERIARVRVDGADVEEARLEPEVLLSVGAGPGEAYRPVRLGEIPKALRDAILAAEDERFFEHGGVDARALLRASWANLRARKVVEGGSTITQQLVKNRLLRPDRTVFRKLQEVWLATAVEWRYSKEQILEAYLNDVYLGQWQGGAIRGVGAASRVYFGKEVHQLTLGESALLAAMIRAPNSYSPAVSPQRARRRRDVVLARMRGLGKIGETDYRLALREPVRAPDVRAGGLFAPYAADVIRQEIDAIGNSDGGAQRVFSTLDLPLQRFAETAVARGLDRLESQLPRLRRRDPAERLQAVLIALDPATGEVRALVGGRDYRTSPFNRATLARRQPGSAFKPFVYLAALAARGERPPFTAASLVDDAPITVMVSGRPWSPRNYKDRYEGPVTVRRALEDSLNGATVRIAQTVGLPAIVRTARALGIESELEAVPAVALGAFEVTPLELARAYLPLAGGGLTHSVRLVESVADGSHSTVATRDESRPVLSPAEAYLMTSLLFGVMRTGTGARAAALGVPETVAGKTGTTNEGRDAWFVGYSSNLLALVWVGFDDGRPHGLSGAEAALPIWSDFMKQALGAYPAAPF
ncbi:MAG TPA: PBP1A family penicillin-binding protein, partial [Gemmatimonadales bacterium]|nr:PBP1A family penicillin-binding protein [Gemmatimonadales bacterium]